MWTIDIYRKAAAILWGAVSATLGLSAGVYYDLDRRKTIFLITVFLGLYILFLLYRFNEKKHYKNPERSTKPQEKNTNNTPEPDSDEKINDPRQWLDDFLVKQQNNKK